MCAIDKVPVWTTPEDWARANKIYNFAAGRIRSILQLNGPITGKNASRLEFWRSVQDACLKTVNMQKA
jgi:hypothetical protein